MKIRALLVGVLLVASTTSALAAGPYIGAAGGVSIFHDSDVKDTASNETATAEFDTGIGFNVSAGYNFDPVRVEFEFGYKEADVDKFTVPGFGSVSGASSDAQVLSYMANAYYDIKTNSPFTPYIGVGLGLLNGEFKDPDFKEDDTVFGYQFAVGAAYNFNKNVAFDVSYRFQGAASDFEVGASEISYMSSNIMAGLRYNF